MSEPSAGPDPLSSATRHGAGCAGSAAGARKPVTFGSILFHGDVRPVPDQPDEPEFFRDLNIDQIVSSITAGREFYNLKPFFHARLTSVDAIHYRHEVLRDLERQSLRDDIGSFAQKMRHMRDCLTMAAGLRHRYQNGRLFLDAVMTYDDAITTLAGHLQPGSLSSRGLLAFREYLAAYTVSGSFSELSAQASQLDGALSEIRYCLHIKGSRIRVTKYGDEPDYSYAVRETFKKFKQGDVKDYRVRFNTLLEMDHVEAGILELVARLYPDEFQALDAFCEHYREYSDAVINRFDREVQFYLACLDYLVPLRRAGLSFCYPDVSAESKEALASDTFDLALASKLVSDRAPVVGNDL